MNKAGKEHKKKEGEQEQERQPITLSGISSRNLLMLSLISGAVYLGTSLLIFYFYREQSLYAAFSDGYPGMTQLLVGAASGILAGAIIRWAASRKPVAGVL
ncbi:MAG: hypothetical protein SVT56_13780, partial [Chloroflexota bacterium]|nr:hypothetical protein [Chloroflexota bacterium]